MPDYGELLQALSPGRNSSDRIPLDSTVKGSNVLPKSQSCFSRLTAHTSVLQQLQQFSDELILTSEKIVASQANFRDFEGGSQPDWGEPEAKPAVNAIVQLKGLNFPPPRTQGQATIPLKPLEGSQDESDIESAWVHAYLHRKEGDISNARYWYRRSQKPEFSGSLQVEWEHITRNLLLNLEK